MPFYLGANSPSATPGGANWINTNTLGGGTLVNQSAFRVTPPLASIPGSDTTGQAFSYGFTIPAGTITPGATLALQWFMLGTINNVGVDSYKWGVSIGGVNTISGVITPTNANTPLLSQAAAFGSFNNALSAPPLIDFVALNGYVQTGAGLDEVVFFLPGIDPALPVPVTMYWEWQAGTDPTSLIELYSLSVNLTGPV